MALKTGQASGRAGVEIEPQDPDSWLDQIRPQPIDTRIQADLAGGRLDAVIVRALEDERCGRLRPLSGDPMQHRAASTFWREYRKLARSIRIQADKQLSLLKVDPLHRSLQLQTIGERQGHAIRSARITLTFRALAIKSDSSYLWFWLGDDESYERAGSPGGGEQRAPNRVRRRNSWLFRNEYWEHCGASRVGYLREIAEGRAQIVAPSALEYRQTIRRHVLCAMQDEEGAALLSGLKQDWYGAVDGPSWDYLYRGAISAGREPGEDASAAVLEWLIRTHGPPIDAANRWYQAVLKPSDRLQALKETKLGWVKTENPIRPWQCIRPDELLSIRIGDFPIEHLYTVEDSDEDIGVVDDWPTAWTRESWNPDGCANGGERSARGALD